MTQNTSFLLSISVVSHGNNDRIQNLLDSLQCYETAKKLQIILTENLPDNPIDFSGTTWGQVKIIRNEIPLGFAHNHNNAFNFAQGAYFCVLNPDIIFVEPIFEALLDRLACRQAIISPLIVDVNETLQDSFRSLPTLHRLLARKLPFYRFLPAPQDSSGLIRPDWIAGMFMLMRRDVYQKLGGFDEKFHLYFEDVDLCTRARIRDIAVWVDSTLRIQHNAQRESRKNMRYFFWHLSSAAKFFTSQTYKCARRMT